MLTDHYACTGRSKSLFRTLCTWIGKASPEFILILCCSSANPNVLAIYAHWLVPVVLCERLWYIHDIGKSGYACCHRFA